MTDILVTAAFTKQHISGVAGQPATGLTLSEITFDLWRINRDTGAQTLLWNSLNPTAEIGTSGNYMRVYTGADFDTYNYWLLATYTGAVTLETNWLTKGVGKNIVMAEDLTTKTYVVQDSVGNPIEGVRFEVRLPSSGRVIWRGTTDVNGVPRNIFNNTLSLDSGTYHFYRYHHDYTFNNPDIETVP